MAHGGFVALEQADVDFQDLGTSMRLKDFLDETFADAHMKITDFEIERFIDDGLEKRTEYSLTIEPKSGEFNEKEMDGIFKFFKKFDNTPFTRNYPKRVEVTFEMPEYAKGGKTMTPSDIVALLTDREVAQKLAEKMMQSLESLEYGEMTEQDMATEAMQDIMHSRKMLTEILTYES